MRVSLAQYGALLVQYLRPQKVWVMVLAVLLFGNISISIRINKVELDAHGALVK